MRLLATGMTTDAVGAQLGVSGTSVSKWKRQGGFIARPEPNRLPDYIPTPEEFEAAKAECRAKHLAEKRAQPWAHKRTQDCCRRFVLSRSRGHLVVEASP